MKGEMKGEMKQEVKSVKWELYEKEKKDKKADSSFFGTLDSVQWVAILKMPYFR